MTAQLVILPYHVNSISGKNPVKASEEFAVSFLGPNLRQTSSSLLTHANFAVYVQYCVPKTVQWIVTIV